MGYYKPQWSVEEQTMIDLMELAGYGIGADINRDYTVIHLHLPHTGAPLLFRDDTEYGAIRKCFAYWEKNNG